MKINFKQNKIDINLKKTSSLGKIIGLMFKPSSTQNLLFEFSKQKIISIHSFFVFFPFLAIWLDENNNVQEYKLVKPFTPHISSKNSSNKLIELPINKKNQEILNFFVDNGKI